MLLLMMKQEKDHTFYIWSLWQPLRLTPPHPSPIPPKKTRITYFTNFDREAEFYALETREFQATSKN